MKLPRWWPWRRRAQTPGSVLDAVQHALVSISGYDHPATFDQMRANKGWAFAANRQIAGRAVRAEPQLYQVSRTAAGDHDRRRVHDHPVLDLLQQPNPDESGAGFHARQVLQLQTAGRFYLEVRPERARLADVELARIAMLRLLEPDRTRPMEYERRQAAAFEYRPPRGEAEAIPGAPATAGERELWKEKPYRFVFRVAMPAADSADGQSPIEAAELAVRIEEALGKLHLGQLVNGLHSGLIFYLLRELDDPVRFERAVLMLKAGLGRAGEPLVLQKKMTEVVPNPLTNKEMEFPQLAETMRRQLLAVLGSADGLVGVTVDYNRANIDGIERIMALGTVDPLNRLVADGYNTWLLPLYRGERDPSWFELTYPSAAMMDELSEADLLVKLAGGKPLITQNEARERLGRRPHVSGDALDAAPAALPALQKLLGGDAGKLPLPGA